MPAPIIKTSNEQKPEVAPGVFASVNSKSWRMAAIGVLVAIVAGGAFAVWRGVQKGQNDDRWERLAAITDLHDEPIGELAGAASTQVDVLARDEYIKKLEDFVAKEPADAAATLHAHSLIAQLQLTQILSATSTTKPKELTARYDAAASHLKTVRDSGVELPLVANRFRPAEAARAVDALLKKIEVNRAWDAAHGLRDAETDPDVVVLLRTTEGDLRVRLYSKPDQSPKLAAAFADHAAKGLLDGTLLFAKRNDSDEGWLRGGDLRIKKTDTPATDDQRLTWGGASPGDPFLPESGRHRIAHLEGTVAAWHEDDDPYDDPSQFLIETKASPHLDTDYTPLGRVEESSRPTLERLAAARTRADEKSDIRLDAKYSKLADQLATPIVIVRALVYDKGVLRASADAKVDESERKLDSIKPDATRVIPPPPPAAPATPPAGTPDASMGDGAAMTETPPAMTDSAPAMGTEPK